jgi:hypothetical protein
MTTSIHFPFPSRLSRRACVAAGWAALAALQPLTAQDAVTRHFWNFEGDFQDKVGGAHAAVTEETTVTLVAGRGGATQAMATLASVGGDNDYAGVWGASDLGSWENLTPTPLPGTGEPMQFQHSPDGPPPRYFYRIELLPR